MAEFCLKCMNEMDSTHLTEADVILGVDLCEGCGKVVPCVIRYRTWPEKVIWSIQKHIRHKAER